MPKLWTKSIGERGNRVRLYEPRPGANLMRSVYIDGKENRRSLGHKDRKRAMREAHAFLAQLGAEQKADEQGSFTLGSLFTLYQRSPAHQGKDPKVRLDDEGVVGPDREATGQFVARVQTEVGHRTEGLPGR